ncbi:hypothetical protein [Streptomyces sp. NPDC050485]|uniref:hypothetical protein n=1 Tax=Streptomyces sp. NPDC050485 TaxID=3365617 RepID=UPI0037BD108B
MYLRYLDEAPAWSDEWRGAASSSDSVARLNPGELAALTDEILALIRKYDEEGRAAEADGDAEGRENVALHLYGFPFRA